MCPSSDSETLWTRSRANPRGCPLRRLPRGSVAASRVTLMCSVLRRLFWLALIGGVGFAGWSLWRRRSQTVGAAGTPVWPPFDTPTTTAAAAPADGTDTGVDAATTPPVAFVALDDDPEASTDASHSHPLTWVVPVDGACPSGYPIKANDNSRIFHMPGGQFYERTIAERCYADAADAEADGYRRAKA